MILDTETIYTHGMLPTFTTSRLSLRQLTIDDAWPLAALHSIDQVNTYINRAKSQTPDEAIGFIERINAGIKEGKLFYWVLTLKESENLIGTICLWKFSEDMTSAEIGYELHPEYHGQGLIHEALQPIINFCFIGLKLNSIDAYTHQQNLASISVLKKNNFVLQADRPAEEENFLIYSRSS
jgi:ribosomal-protein-alanine N-acetyltransferase